MNWKLNEQNIIDYPRYVCATESRPIRKQKIIFQYAFPNFIAADENYGTAKRRIPADIIKFTIMFSWMLYVFEIGGESRHLETNI